MAIIYRAQKGLPLTSDEVDGNFKDLVERIESLEQAQSNAEGIKKIEKKGDVIEIIGTLGTSYGNFKLPTAMYESRGKWCPQTAYKIYDVITLKAQIWVCQKAHTSLDMFEAQNWEILLDLKEALQENLFGHLSLFKKDHLPEPERGSIALCSTTDRIDVIYADGQTWYGLRGEKI